MKKLFFILLFFLPITVSAASSSGLITRTIWYAPEKFFEGNRVRIYAGIFNGFDKDLLGTVEFFVGEKSIGKAQFALERGGNAGSVWVDWTAEYGKQTIRAKVVNARLSGPNGGEPTELAQSSAERVIDFIDKDIDQDGIGNKTDPTDNRPKPPPPVVSSEKGLSPKTVMANVASTSAPFLQGAVALLSVGKTALEARRSTMADKKALASSFRNIKEKITGKETPGVFSIAWEGSKAAGSLGAKAALASLAFSMQNPMWGLLAVLCIISIIVLRKLRRRR